MDVSSVLRQGLEWVTTLLPLALWCAFWLWAVNWKKAWPVLAMGAWAPLVLLIVVSALVWSQIAPGECRCLRFVTIPNFWWQLGDVSSLVALALFFGWLQGVMHWAPEEISFEPAPTHDQHHGHHGHHGHGH